MDKVLKICFQHFINLVVSYIWANFRHFLFIQKKIQKQKIPRCEIVYDTESAMETLLMAQNPSEQKEWISAITKMKPSHPPANPNVSWLKGRF